MRLGELAAGEKFKALAYWKVIANLRRLEGPVRNMDDLKTVTGIGKKIHDKIAEILATGSSPPPSLRTAARMTTAFETLTGVHGIGPVKARELVAAGVTTIEALRANSALLNDTQKMGLKYYEDGLARIPRAEMTAHESTLMSALPTGLNGVIVGSYRRGAETSGDIDMLVSYPEAITDTYASTLFTRFVGGLVRSGYVVDVLASGPKKWMGYVRLPGVGTARRLDLLLTPSAEFPYAILYFTGSDKFNIAFRSRCLERGYTLNEHGMKPVREGAVAVPPMAEEKDIFAFVGLAYVPPQERI